MPPVPGGMPPPPPLLLTKRVTAFLRANLSDLIHDAILTTPAGSLLVQASSLPATTLRRQCAVAASLWAYHNSNISGARAAIPSSQNGGAGSSHGSSPANETSTFKSHQRGAAVTVQLDSGDIFVIRQLACGMLFICMGSDDHAARRRGKSKSSAQGQGNNNIAGASQEDQAEDGHSVGSSAVTTPGTSNPSAGAQATQASQGNAPLGLFSEVDSIHSTGAMTTTSQGSAGTSSVAKTSTSGNVLAMRRQVEELARALDKALGALHVPEAGIKGQGA